MWQRGLKMEIFLPKDKIISTCEKYNGHPRGK